MKCLIEILLGFSLAFVIFYFYAVNVPDEKEQTYFNVIQYSADGKIIGQWKSDKKPIHTNVSYCFSDRETEKLIDISGTIQVIEKINKEKK